METTSRREIRVELRSDGTGHYRLLEPLRQYGLECLTASGEVDAARRRHALHYASLASKAAPELTGPRQGEWLDRLELAHDNLRAALGWEREHQDVALALDVSLCYEHPDRARKGLSERLGNGAAILVHDATMIPNTRLRDWVCIVVGIFVFFYLELWGV